jgi:hypothetical protein
LLFELLSLLLKNKPAPSSSHPGRVERYKFKKAVRY